MKHSKKEMKEILIDKILEFLDFVEEDELEKFNMDQLNFILWYLENKPEDPQLLPGTPVLSEKEKKKLLKDVKAKRLAYPVYTEVDHNWFDGDD